MTGYVGWGEAAGSQASSNPSQLVSVSDCEPRKGRRKDRELGLVFWFFTYILETIKSESSELDFSRFFFFFNWRLITILQLFLPSSDMNQPWVHMCPRAPCPV